MGLASKIKSSEAAKPSPPSAPPLPQEQQQDFCQGVAPSPGCAAGGGAEVYPSASHGQEYPYRQHAYASPAQAQINAPSPYDAYSAPAGPYPFAQQQQRPHGDERHQQHPYSADYAQKPQQPPYGEGSCTPYDGAVQQNYQQAHTPYQGGMEVQAISHSQEYPYGQHAYASPAQAQLNTPSPYAYSAPAGSYPFAQPQQRPHGNEHQQHHPYGTDYAQKQQQPPYGEGSCTPYDGAVQQNYQQVHTPYQGGMEVQANSMPPTSNNMDMLAKKLQLIIQTHGLQRFYDAQRYQIALDKISRIDFAEISAQWKIGKELAYDLAPLVLYDIVFYCDDSGSMAFEENGERIEDLKFILSKVSGIATLFDDDGITVRFMNSNVNGDGIRNPADVSKLISQVRFSGVTPLGTNFERKVIQPLVLGQALNVNASMAKPVLAILITDGEPYGEKKDAIVQVIRRAKDALAKSPYGSGALAVQIAQVGKDAKTQKFLEALDKDPFVGGMIDCTSYYEMEEEEFARKGVTLTPELWLLKMCVGAIDPEYDTQDD
ncbi:hypothetical protein KP509_22G063100 [Ceratopteris richardii]|uniref:VWFA domain-containing protein n=1 Tax=Ceratopteris richardii TaxID=49495 RepID=A0A8T2S8Z9_CERRI|nr:hypothetical protein KP509_22G063100 [Ceratopteris richardii]